MSVSGTSGSSTSLLKTLVIGRAEGWEKLIELYQPLILMWCQQSGLKQPDDSDVTEKVFKKAFENIQQYQSDFFQFRIWFRNITHRCINEHNKVTSNTELFSDEPASHSQRVIPPHVFDKENIDDELETSILFLQALELIKNDKHIGNWQFAWDLIVEENDIQEIEKKYNAKKCDIHIAKAKVLARIQNDLQELIE